MKQIITLLSLILSGSSLVFAQHDTCQLWLLDYHIGNVDSSETIHVDVSMISECYAVYPRVLAYPGKKSESFEAGHFNIDKAIISPLNLFGSQAYEIHHHQISIPKEFDLKKANYYFYCQKPLRNLQLDEFEEYDESGDTISYDSINHVLTIDIQKEWNEARLMFYNGDQFFDFLDLERSVLSGTLRIQLEYFYQLFCTNFRDTYQFVLIDRSAEGRVLYYKGKSSLP